MKQQISKNLGYLLFFLLLSNNLIGNDIVLSDSEEVTVFKSLSNEPLKEVWIKTALDSLASSKRTNKLFPATLTYFDPDGRMINKSISIRPRGKSRRNACEFPPLRIKFNKDELVARGWSKKHKSLKLVTHCNEGLTANRNVLKEYLAYRIYNELAENSLKVQLLKVNYEDIHTGTKLEKYAMLLEDIDELAERLGGREVEGFSRKAKEFDKQNLQIFSVFQYMIGNTDWTIEMYRNVKFIQTEDGKKMKIIPYDFDSSGFVAPAYAKPNPNHKLQSIQQRLFLGKFSNKQERARVIELFKEKQASIYNLVKKFEKLDQLGRLELLSYLDSFYATINREILLNKAMPLRNKKPRPSDMEGEYHLG